MTQRFSQNGWPAYPTTDRYTRFTAGGQGWWAANDDVAVVFTEFIERFIAEVEPIAGPKLDDWSYANRLVRGSATVVSNHGSATAIDLNSLQHPRGSRGTFSKAEQKTMHSIRDSITDAAGRAVLRLGLDYTHIEDDMHVEVDADKTRVKQAADKIRARRLAAIKAAEEADEMKPSDTHKYTAADAAAAGNPALKGKPVSWDALWRFPPSVARLRREQKAEFAALRAAIGALAAAIATDDELTVAQISEAVEAAAERGARAALADMPDDDDDTEPAPPAGS